MKAHYKRNLIMDAQYIKYWKIPVCGSPEGIEITMFTDQMKSIPKLTTEVKKWTLNSIRGTCIMTDNLTPRIINREVCKCVLYNNKVNYQKRFEIW